MKKQVSLNKFIFTIVAILFLIFLMLPMAMILGKSLIDSSGFSFSYYQNLIAEGTLAKAFFNSIWVSSVSAGIAVIIAFILAYTVNYTNVYEPIKKVIPLLTVLTMLLPSITYGFAIIYSFGKQGLITMIIGTQFFDIYGPAGLILGYVIYTVPVAFLLINNTMKYIDKKFSIVSRAMGDSAFRNFTVTVVRPLLGTFAAAFIQTFTLCFTDYGIPTSVGGNMNMMATLLYEKMLGSIPDLNTGSAVAIMMLIPSITSILLLTYLERYNIRYNKISVIELTKNKVRDISLGLLSGTFLVSLLSIFAVIFIVPFVEQWPYKIVPTLEHVQAVFGDQSLVTVYKNSLIVALFSAILGTIIVYGAALISARGTENRVFGKILDSIALVSNTIPGMVIGVAYLLAFTGTPLQNTFPIIIISNVIHFFSSPYLIMKNSLEKLNASWETTAKLMGDSWLKTVVRIITPNAFSSIVEVFSYYFVNSMVTVSAVIFIAGARTMVLTTKIKELQHFADFDEIFVLSILILLTNLVAKGLFVAFSHKQKIKEDIKMNKLIKKVLATVVVAGICMTSLAGCQSQEEQVIIYSNADDEAVEAMKATLNENGYEGKYIFTSLGTSELGGKLLAEGASIEADIVTMSSYYIESAQAEHDMFLGLEFEVDTIDEYPSYYTPFLGIQGTLIINTEEIEALNLEVPTSIADLADPMYSGVISVVDITGSSTAWLMVQALVSEYGEDEAQTILSGIYENAGVHLETSGSAPIKKVRSGEVAIGFGLRHQAIADKEDGLPEDYVDPTEGCFTLTESLAVVNKGDDTNELAMEMVQCIVESGRDELMEYYPVPLYNNESADAEVLSAISKVFEESLTVDLLEQHVALSEAAK